MINFVNFSTENHLLSVVSNRKFANVMRHCIPAVNLWRLFVSGPKILVQVQTKPRYLVSK